MKTPKSFAAALSQTRLPSVFNPCGDCRPVHDRPDAARVRKRNLVRYLEAALAARIDTIWIARDLGYRGGRRTGIPLTDEIHLSQAGVFLGGIALDRATRGPVVAERTAAIVWERPITYRRTGGSVEHLPAASPCGARSFFEPLPHPRRA